MAPDADVGKFLKLFTDLPLDEIERLQSLAGAEINQAKIVLPNEATALWHGREAANAAAETARATFEQGGAGEDLPTLTLSDGLTIIQALTQLGFTQSNKEARRKVEEGAVRLNDQVVSDPAQLAAEGKLSLGKKRHALLVG